MVLVWEVTDEIAEVPETDPATAHFNNALPKATWKDPFRRHRNMSTSWTRQVAQSGARNCGHPSASTSSSSRRFYAVQRQVPKVQEAEQHQEEDEANKVKIEVENRLENLLRYGAKDSP